MKIWTSRWSCVYIETMVVAPFYFPGSGYLQTYPAEQEENRQLKNCGKKLNSCVKLYMCLGLKCIEDVLVHKRKLKLFFLLKGKCFYSC